MISGSSFGSDSLAIGGLASGLDTKSLIQKLMQVESIPMQNLQKQEAQVQSTQGLWSQYSSLLSAFQSASDAMNNASLYTGTSATSSLPNEVTVSSDTTASPGTYNITVKQMATAEVVTSNNFSSGAPALPSSGSFTINGVTVNANSGSASSLTIQQVADAINNTKGVGVSASVVNNQLYLVSTSTGSAGSTYVDGTGSILTTLGVISGGTKQVQTAGKDAQVNVFGQLVTQASNTFTNIIHGVTFTITNPPSNTTNGDNVTIIVSSDTSALQTALQNYVTAYNNVQAFYGTNTFFNKDDPSKSGPLLGDGSLMLYQNQLVSTVTNPIPAPATSGWNALVDFGVKLEKDGTLSIDNATLTSALQGHLQDFETLFMQPASGLVAQTDSLMTKLINPATGTITSQINGYTKQIKDFDQQIKNWQSILTQKQQQLTKQFTDMELAISKMQSQMGALSGLAAYSMPSGN